MSLLNDIFRTIAPLLPEPVVAWGVREFFNRRYKSIGTMTTLQIDSKNKKATLELELKGETQPLQVTIGHYELTSDKGKTFIELKEVVTSREWINALLRDFLKEHKFEVPESIKAVL